MAELTSARMALRRGDRARMQVTISIGRLTESHHERCASEQEDEVKKLAEQLQNHTAELSRARKELQKAGNRPE